MEYICLFSYMCVHNLIKLYNVHNFLFDCRGTVEALAESGKNFVSDKFGVVMI